MKNKSCLVIVGPTAAGKTQFAIDVARHFNTDIISADSRQCYREMNIGVAKPTPAQLQQVSHYFINSHSIFQDVNAKVFEEYALVSMNEIFSSHDVAVVVGGTGLYVKAFCEGLDAIPAIDPSIRKSIIASYDAHGFEWLLDQVAKEDPLFFSTGEIQNPQRMMRALEVKLSTGVSMAAFHSHNQKIRDFKIIKLGLNLPREQLIKNIDTRVDAMMEEGLLDEVRSLISSEGLNALQTVGYSELFDYLDGKITLDNAIELIRINTRQYAKRQVTWFKKDKEIIWLNNSDRDSWLNTVNTY